MKKSREVVALIRPDYQRSARWGIYCLREARWLNGGFSSQAQADCAAKLIEAQEGS